MLRPLCAGVLMCCPLRAVAANPLQLVETFPIETSLDHTDVPDALDVWLEMIGSAQTSLDFAEFYASNEAGSRLESVVQAIEAAAARGVRVRFLAENGFYRTYPETLDRLDALQGVTVRRFDVRSLTGGVLHAKYFLVDAREAFVGSQNFDWRALTHIQELGMRVGVPEIVGAFMSVFEHDWKLAAGEAPSPSLAPAHIASTAVVQDGDTLRVTAVFSPKKWVPEASWDLPRLVELIDAAHRSVRVQLLTYRTVGRDSTYFGDLESALRRAAARGVQVQLLLADWSKRRGTIEGLQSLQTLPNIEVKLVTIPPWSGGFVPFARVIHAKYMVVDGERFWLGTSNWERDYFDRSRNAGLIVEGKLAQRLERFFLDNWNGLYASDVDPCAPYEPPRIGP
jgi:phosphatidylserine/phosphatidylglycerophosphate/cardiolipin synthase-like enzyme